VPPFFSSSPAPVRLLTGTRHLFFPRRSSVLTFFSRLIPLRLLLFCPTCLALSFFMALSRGTGSSIFSRTLTLRSHGGNIETFESRDSFPSTFRSKVLKYSSLLSPVVLSILPKQRGVLPILSIWPFKMAVSRHQPPGVWQTPCFCPPPSCIQLPRSLFLPPCYTPFQSRLSSPLPLERTKDFSKR